MTGTIGITFLSEMKLIKQWHLGIFGDNDVEYVRGLECNYEINNAVKTIEINAPNGQLYRIADRSGLGHGLYITTETKKQEFMLLLKYTGTITLLRAFYANDSREWARYEY